MTQTLVLRTAPLSPIEAKLIVIYTGEATPPRGEAAEIWAATGLDFARVSAAAGFTGKQGQLLDIAAPSGIAASRLFVLGAGRMDADHPASGAAWSDRGGSLAAKLMAANAETVAVLLDGHDAMPAAIAELAAGLKLRHYRFDKYKAKKNGDRSPDALTVTLHVPEPIMADAAIAQRMAAVDGTLLARDLMNEPANVLGTEEFAARAAELSTLGVSIETLGEPELRALGMNALLSVSQGSVRPPRLVVMRWTGAPTDVGPFAFVGKAIKGVCIFLHMQPGK